MTDPLFKTQINDDTGELRQLMSSDDGASWEVVSNPGMSFFKTQRNDDTGETRHVLTSDQGKTWRVPSSPDDWAQMPAGGASASPAEWQGPLAPAPKPMTARDAMMLLGEKGIAGLQAIPETLYDGAVGASQGLSMGGADEFMGAMPGTSIPEQQAIVQQARERSPTAFNLGNAAGGVLPAMATAGGSAIEQLGASALQGGLKQQAARALEQVGMGALQGGATGFLSSNGDATDRTHAGEWGAGIGGGVGALGAAASGLSVPLQWVANKARLGSFATPGKFSTNAREKGVDYASDELIREGERLGIFNKAVPQSARDIEKRAAGIAEQQGSSKGAQMDAAEAAGIRGDKRAVIGGLEDLSNRKALDPTSERRTVPPIYQEMIDNLERDLTASRQPATMELPVPGRPWAQGRTVKTLGPEMSEMTPRELFDLKKAYERKGGYVSDEIKGTPTGLEREAYQAASVVPRQQLADVMGEMGDAASNQFGQTNHDFEIARTIENLAKERAIHNASPAGIAQSAGIGGTLGFFGGGPAGAAAGMAAGAANRMYGSSAVANGSRALEWLANRGGGFTRSASGAAGQEAGGVAATKGDREAAAQRSMEEGRGHTQPAKIAEVLSTQPQALGQYAQQLQEAQQSGDPQRFISAISNLNQDPQFRELYRQLTQTGEMR